MNDVVLNHSLQWLQLIVAWVGAAIGLCFLVIMLYFAFHAIREIVRS